MGVCEFETKSISRRSHRALDDDQTNSEQPLESRLERECESSLRNARKSVALGQMAIKRQREQELGLNLVEKWPSLRASVCEPEAAVHLQNCLAGVGSIGPGMEKLQIIYNEHNGNVLWCLQPPASLALA